ncbi:lipoic acid synthetase [Virgibacillus natechei]|uniref:Lipoyl synthase n=1 Tax=Virgibacillus natechei TaxID=1216297 RepID=A0ABS4IC02_9BACI|nr:lipoyl synthase [Virgibacillus natechei]MBP1968478.1 lipoic acid synthetase [Virgibacillus natechei]UZD13596.1 lipoyl synthase [Virgibacillus natechei]
MAEQATYIRKPKWLKTKINTNESYRELKHLMRDKKLNTVCEEARCPNIYECWSERQTATFMILGDTCTRGCRFCAVKTGLPNELDWGEPKRVAESVAIMGLKHTVITAVARDDLKDGGAAVFAETVRQIRTQNPGSTIEILPSDMKGDYESLHTLMDSGPDIFNHNIETVRRLTKKVRAIAMYDRSLQLLQRVKEIAPDTPTKSSIMVGLGETKEELIQAMDDLLAHDVDIVTIGQYLQPTKKHLPVERYYHPDEFEELKQIALEMGFRHCEAGPFVRSSYHADEQVTQASAQRRIDYMKGVEDQENTEVKFNF